MLIEVFLGVDEGVEQVAIFTILFGLEIEGVEELEETLCELGDLYIRWARLNLTLNDCD